MATADTQTPHYPTWVKPAIGGDATTWGSVINTTLDAIDEVVWANQDNLGLYLPLTGGTITDSLVVNTNFSVIGTAFFGNGNVEIDNAGTLSTTGAIAAASIFASGSITTNGAVNANVVNVNNAVTAGSVTTNGVVTANGGVNAGSAIIQTTGNASVAGTLTAGGVTANLQTRFFASYYGDFGTSANTSNNSRTLQFANGWNISAIVSSSAYYFQIGGNNVMTLDYTGNLVIYNQGYKPGGGSWGASSDERVKRDIEPYRSGLEEVCRLDPVSFNYNGKGGTSDDGKRYVGLIAQMAQRVMPSLVHDLPGEFDGKLDGQLGLDSSELVFTLINAVKELLARVEELEAR